MPERARMLTHRACTKMSTQVEPLSLSASPMEDVLFHVKAKYAFHRFASLQYYLNNPTFTFTQVRF